MGTVVTYAPSEQAKFDVGSTVGDYQLVKRIDGDVFGQAFLATHRSGGEDAVLHTLHFGPDKANEANRVVEWMLGCQDIVHPFLARTIQVIHSGDRVGVATQSNDGNTLAEMVASDGEVPSELVYTIIRQVALALKCIHDHGHVHLAVEPKTIFLQASGDVQLLGLGPAILHRDVATKAVGDTRNDLKNLGLVAGFLLSGNHAFDSDALPEAWEPIIDRMTATPTDGGCESMEDAIRELDRAFDPAWVEETAPSKPLSLLSVDPDEAMVYRPDAASPSTPSLRNWLLASCRQLFNRR